jgi:hypothetical protein
MNCNLSTIYGPFSPRGLYAPECRDGTSEDIPRADKIGIAAVIAANAPEHLSRAVAPILSSTLGTGAGRASRIETRERNTYIPDIALDLTDDEPRALGEYLRCMLNPPVLAQRGPEPMPPYGAAHRAGKALSDMCLATMVFVCLIGFAATVVGCAPTTPQARACEPGTALGTPWVPADYANGKWVPGHCLGQPAQ